MCLEEILELTDEKLLPTGEAVDYEPVVVENRAILKGNKINGLSEIME